MLRPTIPDDTAVLLSLTRGTGVFKPHEIEALEEVLDDYHAVNHEYDHRACTWVANDGETVEGFVYFAPTAMTDRTWEMWWIAVDRSRHRHGLGSEMLKWVEREVASLGGRLLLIETSSLPVYDATRAFYRKHHYDQVAQIPDFYSDGDDKVIFSKRISGHPDR